MIRVQLLLLLALAGHLCTISHARTLVGVGQIAAEAENVELPIAPNFLQRKQLLQFLKTKKLFWTQKVFQLSLRKNLPLKRPQLPQRKNLSQLHQKNRLSLKRSLLPSPQRPLSHPQKLKLKPMLPQQTLLLSPRSTDEVEKTVLLLEEKPAGVSRGLVLGTVFGLLVSLIAVGSAGKVVSSKVGRYTP
ncbi:hypothetical protein ANANG_G00250830 [Anguilla anguilla]|uniref:Uncharacterized protein n=1 Tax=Anguilla anguilla TaxID=7936 RepID=A0A9D3RMN0_ANGAN|nr:hypothetical protein ANANG_G00250830 [Anguilla anguilla]